MRWVLTNIISWTVGMTIGFSVWRVFGGVISINTATGSEGMDFSQGELVGTLILGIIVAFGQYLILRSRVPSRLRWGILTWAGLFFGALLARSLGQPILQYSDCGFFCFGFDLLPIWLPISFGGMTFITGGPIAGIILGCGMAFSQVIFLKQRRSIKVLWIVTSGLSLALAFTLGIFISREILIVGAITGLIYGAATVLPLKRLSQAPAPDNVVNT